MLVIVSHSTRSHGRTAADDGVTVHHADGADDSFELCRHVTDLEPRRFFLISDPCLGPMGLSHQRTHADGEGLGATTAIRGAASEKKRVRRGAAARYLSDRPQGPSAFAVGHAP